MNAAPRTVDEYLAALPEEQHAALQNIRETVRATVPDAAESISYGIPTFKYMGRPLIYFGAAKSHCAVYGMSVMHAHADELKAYDTSKGTIRFPADKPLPTALVKKMVKAQMKENEARPKSGYGKKETKEDNNGRSRD